MDANQRQFSLLMVDDEPAILSALKRVFRKLPYTLHTAQSGDAALSIIAENIIDAALVDLKMPGMDGLELTRAILDRRPTVRVVILTGHGGVREAVAAIQMGAVDFLQKPFEPESLIARMDQIHRLWCLEEENRFLRENLQFRFGFDQLVGNTAIMLQLKKMILQVAGSDASILIQGETGTGKELVARAIHCHSPRCEKSYVPVDCAGISESVMGSELFGHVRGAFTGAHESTLGLIRSAHGGTLFLDEVGELSMAMQVKLLRTIQEREVRPVGASTSHPVDVRFLAATNRDLEAEVSDGRFRQDLYYRLNVVVIQVPPLAQRVEDIPLLAHHFLSQFDHPGTERPVISPEALACLTAYSWPGNVRELENVMRRAVAMGPVDAIRPADLPEALTGMPTDAAPANVGPVGDGSMKSYEIAAICNALRTCNGHRRHAATMLGIGEATLYRKIAKYKIEG